MKTIKNYTYPVIRPALSRSFAALWMSMVGAMTMLPSCSSYESLSPEGSTPITVSATIPGDVWAVASRGGEGGGASGGGSSSPTGPQYSDWTLHYTDYKGAAATYKYDATTMGGNSVTLTNHHAIISAILQFLAKEVTCNGC